MGQIAHALLTRPPLEKIRRPFPARLACVRHAASVRPEPGSNSYVQSFTILSSLSLPKNRCLSQKSDCFSFALVQALAFPVFANFRSCLSFSLYRFQGSLSSLSCRSLLAICSLAATGDSIAKTPGFVNTFFRFIFFFFSSYYIISFSALFFTIFRRKLIVNSNSFPAF